MRALALLATIVSLLMGCKDATGASLATGVNFRLDPQTCFDMGTPNLGVRLFVDGVLRGRDTLSIGEFSKVIAVSAGSHTVQVQEDYELGYMWPQQGVTVQTDQTVTVLLRC